MKTDDERRRGSGAQAYDSVFVRKSSISAFVAAARAYDAAVPDSEEAVQAAAEICAALPAIVALGVLDVFALKSARVGALVKALDSEL